MSGRFFCVFWLLIGHSAALDSNFGSYPFSSQNCLYEAAYISGCRGDTGHELNSCLCTNEGDFVSNAAKCIGQDSPDDLDSVYSIMWENCSGTGDTLSVSEEDWLAQASATSSSSTGTIVKVTSTRQPSTTSTVTSTSTTSSPTTLATSASNNSGTSVSSTGSSPTQSGATGAPSSSPQGLSTGAKIGAGVGISFGAIALGLAGAFVWMYNRRHRKTSSENESDEGLQGNSPPGDPDAKKADHLFHPPMAELGGDERHRSELWVEPLIIPVEMPTESSTEPQHTNQKQQDGGFGANCEIISEPNSPYPTLTVSPTMSSPRIG